MEEKRNTLIEAARRMRLNQRAEVKDVLKQILYPDDGKPILTVSVYFDADKPAQLISRGKFGEEDFWSLPAEASACVTLTGLFDIYLFVRTTFEDILRGTDEKNYPWPDEDGFYTLNSRRSNGLVVILVQEGIAYEWRGKKALRESDLVISEKNLVLYAEQRGITLLPDEGESPSEEAEVQEKEPYTQEQAASLINSTPEIILKELISPGPYDKGLTPVVYISKKKASSVRLGREVELNGYYEVEGIKSAPRDSHGNYVISFGGRSRILLHRNGDTFFLHSVLLVEKENLNVSAKEIDERVLEIERNTPPKAVRPRSSAEEYIDKRSAEGARKEKIAAELIERGSIHWGLLVPGSPKQWCTREEAARRMEIPPEKVFEEGYLMFPVVYFEKSVQLRYVFSYKSEEKPGIWFDSIYKDFEPGSFFQINNFYDLSSRDGFYQIGNGKACLWQDISDREGHYLFDKPLEVNKSKLLVAIWDLQHCLEIHGRTGEVSLPESDHLQAKPPIAQSNLLNRERGQEIQEKPLMPEEYVKKKLEDGLSKEEIATELRTAGKTYSEIGRLLCDDGSFVTFDTMKKRGERLVKKTDRSLT